MRAGENNRKDEQNITIFSITERKIKLAYRYFCSMSDEESRSARKRMGKFTSGVFIVFFLRIALKRAI